MSGETESGVALAVLARPVRRSQVLLGKWLGLVAFGSGFVVGGRARPVPRRLRDHRLLAAAARRSPCCCSPSRPTVLLTLAVLLSTAVSPMASGVVAVGLFCTTWVAGVVGGVGTSLGNDAVARVGRRVAGAAADRRAVARGDERLPGPVRAARCSAAGAEAGAFPFLGAGPADRRPTWCGPVLWVALVWGAGRASFVRKDL